MNFYWLGVMVLALVAPAAGWLASKRGARGRSEARAHLKRLVELVPLAKSGTSGQLAGADRELQQMTEWLLDKLAGGEIERDQFQCIERVISQLRTAIEKRLSDHNVLPPEDHMLVPTYAGITGSS